MARLAVTCSQGGQGDPGWVSLCKGASALASLWEHQRCLQITDGRVRTCFAGFSVGGSDVAELRAGMPAGHVGVLSGLGQVEPSITCALT